MISKRWIQTHQGKQFFPLAPTVSAVGTIEEIAHALSMKCRFSGHTREFYCPTPDQRILTADLRWVPAGDLRLGDELFGFDEYPWEAGSGGNRRRRFRHSTVTHAEPVWRQIVRLEFSDGASVRASAEHPWLVATKQSNNQSWLASSVIADDISRGRRRYINRFADPWGSDGSRDAAWLAGIFDGEGSVSFIDRGGVQLSAAQLPGLVLDEIERVLAAKGFTYHKYPHPASGVYNLQMSGGWREMARLVGSIRPVRMLDKLTRGLRAGSLDKQMSGLREPLEIVGAYFEGEGWVSGLSTSSRTYICEGFGAHNSVAEHCVIGSRWIAPEFAGAFLLHELSEVYLPDIPAPIKPFLHVFYPNDIEPGSHISWKKLEAMHSRVMLEALGHSDLEVDHEIVKLMDLAMLATEKRDLMGKEPAPWDLEVAPVKFLIPPWSQQYAEKAFLKRYYELFPADSG